MAEETARRGVEAFRRNTEAAEVARLEAAVARGKGEKRKEDKEVEEEDVSGAAAAAAVDIR